MITNRLFTMKHRLLTYPTEVVNEGVLINRLFNKALPILHLRKPSYNKKQIEQLLQEIDSAFHNKIILHQYHDLATIYNCCGVHLTEEAKTTLAQKKELKAFIQQQHSNNLLVGTSSHHPPQLEKLPKTINYTFVSPVFPSISKYNYHPTYHWDMKGKAYPFDIIGLGGMQANNLTEAAKRGFGEIAFLGAVWGDLNPAKISLNYQSICRQLNGLMP